MTGREDRHVPKRRERHAGLDELLTSGDFWSAVGGATFLLALLALAVAKVL